MTTHGFVYILRNHRSATLWRLVIQGGLRCRNSNLAEDFLTMHLPTEFHRPMFNRSKLSLTNTQTHPQTNEWTLLKTSTSLHYATLLEKN